MLSKCANPACLARFHYLHQGRIFNIEMAAVASDAANSSTRRIEHFWLCERCSPILTVVQENGAVTTRTLRLELKAAPQEKSDTKRRVA